MSSDVTLPPAVVGKIDCNKLGELLADVYGAVAERMCETQPGTHLRLLMRPDISGDMGGYSSQYVEFPNTWSMARAAEEEVKSKEAKLLMDYLWSCGYPQIRFGSPTATKENWERAVFGGLVLAQMGMLVERGAVKQAVSSGTPEILRPPQEAIDSLAAANANLLAGRLQRIGVTFLHPALKVGGINPAFSPMRIDPGLEIGVSKWGYPEFCEFISRHEIEIWDPADFIPDVIDTAVDLTLDLPADYDVHEVDEKVVETLDLLRLCLTLVDSNQWQAGESTVVVSPAGPRGRGRSRLIRRDTPLEWTPLEASLEVLEHLDSNLRKIGPALTGIPDLKDALWRFGRACTAQLADDKLVEGVIGLEGLIVPGPGESRYRFGLHLAALMCSRGEDVDARARTFRDWYNQRSGHVHRRGTNGKSKHLCGDVIVHLARAVNAIVNLEEQGLIPESLPVAQAIERLVLLRATENGP